MTLPSVRQQQILQAMGIPIWRARGATQLPDVQPQQSKSSEVLSQTEIAEVPPINDLAHDWQAFEKTVSNCQQCTLHQTRRHVVIGAGPRQVELCVIGEAPGAEEDKQGQPFVGRAGQLLTPMIEAIGLSREQVYITNILKCRPPGNRDPQSDEIAKCTPYLLQQLAWLQPKVILLLGRIAAQTLLETQQPMRQLRGQVYTYAAARYPVVVTYHPAYLLRNPSDKAKAFEDLLQVKRLLLQTGQRP